MRARVPTPAPRGWPAVPWKDSLRQDRLPAAAACPCWTCSGPAATLWAIHGV